MRRLLALDAVQDPGNLGTLLRTALAFGWDGVFLLPGCADPFSDKAVRASRGAALRAPVARGGVDELCAAAEAHGLTMLAADPEPEGGSEGGTRGDLPLKGWREQAGTSAVCLVLGSEGQGLSAEVRALTIPVAIPMHGGMESLNVAVAGGILMFIMSSGLPQLTRRLEGLLKDR